MMLRLCFLMAVGSQLALAEEPAVEVQSEVAATTETGPLTGLELQRAKEFLERLNNETSVWYNRGALAQWAYDSNLTAANLVAKIHMLSEAAAAGKAKWAEIQAFPWQRIGDDEIRRQFSKHARLGVGVLEKKDYEDYENTVANMQQEYSTARICEYKEADKCDLALEPHLTELLMSSRDPEELKHVWIEWRKATGEKVKPLYPKYVDLINRAARLNNYTDNAASWLDDYETDNFAGQIENLWQQMRPLYLELHAYVRNQLREKYGDQIVSRDGPLPAHLLGNMWAQTWEHIADFSTPYPGKKLPDATENMVKQGYDANRIFHLADSFFTSLNLSAVSESFWTNSILEKPNDGRELVCHASAWDFYDGKDFRIKQCTRVNSEDLSTAHHEMGHIQYYMQYKDQPFPFREGANPGFHEAIGDVMALSVSTLQHLKKINLLDQDTQEDPEAMLNYLYIIALQKVAFLPFGYAVDKWRWNVFRGSITPDKYNCDWWKLVHELQGVEPPVDRSEEDFDVASKYHVIASVEYIRYFVSTVIQFQFHKSLCQVAGQYDPADIAHKPLHQCDIYQSKEAGNLLGSMLKLGSSKPWPDAMEVITGQREMDAAGLLEYFNPLYEWLKVKNKETGAHVGWTSTSKRCVQTRSQLQLVDSPSTA
ncbi:angiotensin-converting enzyme [Neodiprion lecontei]|uniref:Angiotensin-converting enzyme n=1 Tax=Neodiprion lecontei TaxID=441921 RepID=A0A6J0BLJ6_NEOLC|nr:angiotensin-converting enzyme [Neodiprion lecontei]XP_046595726.1 angiotensin-converting enzyme [Neodiprion lecontei]